MGVVASQQMTSDETYSFAYAYNVAGALTSETYPSGRVVNIGFNGANRTSTVTGNMNGQQTNYHHADGVLAAWRDVLPDARQQCMVDDGMAM
jgi:hypothetical protein